MKATPSETPEPGLVSVRRLNQITLVLVLGAITTFLDTTIVNIALDHLRTVFHASVSETQWVSTGYLLAYVAVIPVSGWLSERFGARRVWMVAVGLFLLGSLLCGVSTSLPMLIIFRVLQGIGGGVVLPLTSTMLTRAAGKQRLARAMGAIGLIGQLAPILGPIIGGSILTSLSWHWLFFVNVPICLGALILAIRLPPDDKGRRGHPLDVIGFVLLTPGVIAIAYGISQGAGSNGFAALDAWMPLVIGSLLIVAFALYSSRTKRQTLLDLHVFARRSFWLSSIITFVGGGVIITMIGVLPFALAGLSGGDVLLMVGQFLQGFGMGAVSLPVMTLAFAGLSPAETPRGSASFSVVQRVGAPFGVTVIAVILQHGLSHATTPQLALGAFSATFWWTLGLSAIPLLLAFFVPSARAKGLDRASDWDGDHNS